ncbi:MAG TPA: papain fold toxin domain-containing protein [Halomicronema sp.]
MSELSREEIYQEVGKIVGQFPLLKCKECAETVMAWLKENGIEGKILRLKTKYRDEDYIISERLERQGIFESITVNGQHYGVEVLGRVFDSLSLEELTREDWLKDFHCPTEQFIVDEVKTL